MNTNRSMASKTISITEEIYEKLVKIKSESESFSQLFQRMLELYNSNIDECFGAWKLSESEFNQIWKDIYNRSGRKWDHDNVEV